MFVYIRYELENVESSVAIGADIETAEKTRKAPEFALRKMSTAISKSEVRFSGHGSGL